MTIKERLNQSRAANGKISAAQFGQRSTHKTLYGPNIWFHKQSEEFKNEAKVAYYEEWFLKRHRQRINDGPWISLLKDIKTAFITFWIYIRE